MRTTIRSSDGTASGEPVHPALRISLALLTLSMAAAWSVFALSRSSEPAVLGRYSPRLFILVAVSGAAILLLACLTTAWRPAFRIRLHGWLESVTRRGPLLEVWAFGTPVILGIFAWAGSALTPLAAEPFILAGLAGAYAGTLGALLSSCGVPRRKLAGSRFLLFVGSAILTAALLEAALRVVMPGSIFHPALDLRPHIRLRLNTPDLPGVGAEGWYSTNKWGMRGEEPPADWDGWLTIVCMGGSTTQCFELDDHLTWPWLVQENLRTIEPMTWVGNGGLAGHSSRAHLVFMREVIGEIRPDVVIVLLGVNEKVNYDLGERPELEAVGVTTTTFGYRLFCASRLAQLLYSLKKAWVDEVPVQNTPWASRLTIEPMTGPEIELPEDLHDLFLDRDFTRNNVRQIIAMAREYGVTPVFLTQPMLYEDTPYWRTVLGYRFSSLSRPGAISAATWWRLLDTTNRDVMEVCAEEGAACYDLASAVPHSTDCFFDDIHFSEAGARIVADSVSAFLAGLGLQGLRGGGP